MDVGILVRNYSPRKGLHESKGKLVLSAMSAARGVSCIVGFGGRPIAVADALVAHFQQRSNGKFVLISFQVGEKVRIVERRFVDLDAIFMEKEGDECVVLLITC